jgi:hypothetical protein
MDTVFRVLFAAMYDKNRIELDTPIDRGWRPSQPDSCRAAYSLTTYRLVTPALFSVLCGRDGVKNPHLGWEIPHSAADTRPRQYLLVYWKQMCVAYTSIPSGHFVNFVNRSGCITSDRRVIRNCELERNHSWPSLITFAIISL